MYNSARSVVAPVQSNTIAEIFPATQLRDIAAEAATCAGTYLASVFREPVDTEFKCSPHDQVTKHDRAAEQRVRDVIGARCPGSIVVGEETGAAPAGQATDGTDASHIVWHVDPLDGTSNFVQGLAFFCTSIAAEVDGEIRAAAIYDPMADMLYTADGDAAYLNGEAFSTPEALPLPAATLITGYPTAMDLQAEGSVATDRFQSWVEAFSSVRRTGSGALSIVHVATGWTDASLGTGTNAWDVAAAMLILRRAGGTYRALRYSDTNEATPDHHAPGYLALGPGADFAVLNTAVEQLKTRQPCPRT